MNIEKLKNIADYKSRVSLISLFGDDKISENIETDIPETFAEETNINSNEDKDENTSNVPFCLK